MLLSAKSYLATCPVKFKKRRYIIKWAYHKARILLTNRWLLTLLRHDAINRFTTIYGNSEKVSLKINNPCGIKTFLLIKLYSTISQCLEFKHSTLRKCVEPINTIYINGRLSSLFLVVEELRFPLGKSYWLSTERCLANKCYTYNPFSKKKFKFGI